MEHKLHVTLQDLLSYRDKNIQIDMAVLNFSKAFDAMPHRLLLGKLSHYGIHGPILRWIEAILEDRVQGMVVEGRCREPCWEHYCASFTLMIYRLLSIHRSVCLPMIVSCIIPSTRSTTSPLFRGTCHQWRDGRMHGAWSSTLKNARL